MRPSLIYYNHKERGQPQRKENNKLTYLAKRGEREQYMKIKELRQWSMEAIRRECIEHEWYTKGTNKDYEKMLEFISTKEPTNANMLKVATNILEHSNTGYSIDFVLYCISNYCVKRFYDVTE